MAGGAGGYNIPVSISDADSFSVPQTLSAPYLVNFGGSIVAPVSTTTTATNPTTATSAAAEGNANATTKDSGVNQASNLTTKQMILIGVGISVVSGLIIYFATR